MKHLILSLLIITSTYFVNAQTKSSPTFAKINELISRANGRELDQEGTKEIMNQIFCYDSILVSKSYLFDEISYVITNIDWRNVKFALYSVNERKDLLILKVKLGKEYPVKQISKERVSQKKSIETTNLEEINMFFLTKDKDAISKVLRERWQ